MNFKYIGQCFLIKPSVNPSKEELEFYEDLNFCNFIFFREHLEGESLRFYEKTGLKAVDQEGGRVCRIKGDFEAPLEIGKRYQETKDKKVVKDWATKIAKSLKERGLNFNLAPCVDLGDESSPEFLRGRTFSTDPDVVIEVAKEFLNSHQKEMIFTCLKHFPGLKSVKIDPHLELPLKEKPDKLSLLVFESLIRYGADFVMTTHLILKELDEEPITFSQRGIEFLRKGLGFKGIVVSDDLNMGALKRWELEERLLKTIASGHNLLIYCGNWKEVLKSIFEIKSELENSKILKKVLVESQELIKRLKIF